MEDPRRDAERRTRPAGSGPAGESAAARVHEGLAAYPADLEHPATLADGRAVFIRPIRASDGDQLRRAISAADPETLHARFLGLPPSGAMAIQRLVEVDYVHRLALVAFDAANVGVAIARYEGRIEDDTAEAAVVVDHGWRRVGLGNFLLRDLSQAALRRGITRFSALVLAENRPALALLRSSGLPYSVQTGGGTSEIVIRLAPVAAPPPAAAR